MLTSGVPDDHRPPDLEPVPHLSELAHAGLAVPIAWGADGGPVVFIPTPDGHARLGEAMARNAARCRAWIERGC